MAKCKALLKDVKQVDCHSCEIISLVIGSLGTILNWTNTELRGFKLSRFKEALEITVIKGSVNILNQHLRHSDFNKLRSNGMHIDLTGRY